MAGRFLLILCRGLHIQRTKGNPVRPYFEVSRPDLHVLSAKTLHIRPSDKPDLSTSSLGTFENWLCTARRIFFLKSKKSKKIYISINKSQNGAVFQTQDCSEYFFVWGWLSRMCQKIVGLGQRSHGQTQVQTHEFIHGGKQVIREAGVKTGNQSMSRENKLDSVNMGEKKTAT